MRWRGLILCIVLVALLSATASAEPRGESSVGALAGDFLEAGEDYRSGRYEEAQSRYEGLVLAGWRNGALFYALGNTYFQTGELGEAVRAYRRAERYLPRNADLRHNQALAEGTVEDVFSRSGFGHVLGSAAFWYERSTLRELTWATIALWLCTAVALSARLLRPGVGMRALSWTMGGVLLAVGASAGVKAWVLHRTDPAIVLVESLEVRAGPSFREAVTATLSEGNAVEIRGAEGAYLRVELPDGAEGWVRAETLGRIGFD